LALCNVIPSGFDCLSGLRSLQQLALDSCTHVPACLGQLGGLEDFTLTDDGGMLSLDEHSDTADILSDAWPMLAQRLTSLTVPAAAVGPFLAAQSLTACSRLQSLFVLSPIYEQPGHEEPLVQGPALPGLRRLAATLATLVGSLPVLQAATQLECVGAICFDAQLPGLPQLLDWAVQLPTLRQLVLIAWASEQLDSYFHLIVGAQQRRPRLHIMVQNFAPTDAFPTAQFLFEKVLELD